MKKRIFSAMRPTGKLHLGHLVGALHNWVELQKEYSCVFGIVDWHALMGEYEQSYNISENILDMAIDWIACGIDPEKSIIFIQSQVPEHLELQMILSCITPLGWLERNPTYKEQLREIKTRNLQTYAFLGYPVLQAADILLYKANAVPIGEDQLPHIELTREISRRFNHIYKTGFFQDCEAIL
ncbi:MAG: tryptophan--tRNA ligase, partial [Candidatus Heimdallarchaeota archaeon]|nr:tryptophan--tRNA ligase [Candidatus Heimdallarchaeota archaeon]